MRADLESIKSLDDAESTCRAPFPEKAGALPGVLITDTSRGQGDGSSVRQRTPKRESFADYFGPRQKQAISKREDRFTLRRTAPRNARRRAEAVSEICRDEIVRSPESPDVHPGSGGTYQDTVRIERVQETPLIEMNTRLNSLQRVLAYEKRCLNSTIVSPKPHCPPRSVV